MKGLQNTRNNNVCRFNNNWGLKPFPLSSILVSTPSITLSYLCLTAETLLATTCIITFLVQIANFLYTLICSESLLGLLHSIYFQGFHTMVKDIRCIIILIEIFYDPQDGKVLTESVNIKQFQLKWIRKKMDL